jgi:hypothetical protein
MENDNYQLHLNQVYDTEPTPTTPAIIHVDASPSPTPPPAVSTFGESTVGISDSLIDFGPLSPTDPILREATLSIKGDYFPFFLYQTMPGALTNIQGDEIPKTSCDNGSCSLNQASLWNNTLTYGLGVRCDNIAGTVCPDDFITKNTFRSLGSNEQSSIMASGNITGQASLTLSYKLVVSGTQAQGRYKGSIDYILVPGI